MSDPGTTRPFSPAELDAIEDALEQLHGDDAFVVGGLPADGDAVVRERLASYRAISRLSRDVLHTYEAPHHVLDRVVSLARESAVARAPAPESTPVRASFWSRIRAAWTIPLVATVAAAALVVIVAVPMMSTTGDATSASDGIARNDEAPARSPAAAVPPAAESAPAQGVEGRLAMAEPAAEEEAVLEAARGGAAVPMEAQRDLRKESGDDDAQLGRSRKTATKNERLDDGIAAGPKATPSKPSPKPSPTTTDVPTTPSVPGGSTKPAEAPKDAETTEKKKDADKGGGDALAKADALRRAGDCGSAAKLYESVRKTGTKAQRAKALVGLALCAEREGDRARADELLAKARADDADIDAYYESER
jgi:hypothetical protein